MEVLADRSSVGVAQVTDARSQELLEFPLIRARLAALTAFAPSRRLAEALSPSSEPRGGFTAEVDLVSQLAAALSDSTIARVLRDTLMPAIQALLGPLLPADVRSFG